MARPRNAALIALGALTFITALVLVGGIFRLRAAGGDIFARYSTYRADPLGAMAVFEALRSLPGHQVERYLDPFEKLPEGDGTTLVIAGASLGPDPTEILEGLEAFAAEGGRAVIAFRPIENDYEYDYFVEQMKDLDAEEEDGAEREENADPDADETDVDVGPDTDEESGPVDSATPVTEPERAPAATPSEAGQPIPSSEDPQDASGTAPSEASPTTALDPAESGVDGEPADDSAARRIKRMTKIADISERWDFGYGMDIPGGFYRAQAADSALAVEPEVTCRTGLYFEDVNDRWKPIYTNPDSTDASPRVLVMERAFGAGAIVLSADSYFLSNEALRKHRAPQFLHWLFGANPKILFSEVQLGTQRTDRIMTLVRRYRLHGVLFGLIVLGGLFVWRNASTLLPRVERSAKDYARAPAQSERSHQEGLDNLLARFVRPGDLVRTCVSEWLQHVHGNPRAERIREMAAELEREAAENKPREHPVVAYNRLAEEINRRH